MSLTRFDHLIFGVLIISIFTVAMVAMIVDLDTNYDEINMTSSDFKNMTQIISETLDISEDSKNRTFDSDVSGQDESWESMTKGSYNAIRLVKDSFGIFGDLTQHYGNKLQIPSIYLTIGFSMLVIGLVFASVYMIFRFIPR